MAQARPCRTGCPSASSRVAFRTLLPILGLLVINSPQDPLRAQSPNTQGATPVPEPGFEVASVKVNQQTLAELVRANQNNSSAALSTIGIRTLPGGRLSAGFVTLRALILRAFDVKTYQLEGGPAWANTTNFTIEARAGGEATPQEFNAMLKALLVERFALRMRTEVREMPLHQLTLARSDGRLGSQLKPTSPACIAEMEERRKNPGQPPTTARPASRSLEEARESMRTPICGVSSLMSSVRSMTFSFSGQPLSTLVSRLSSELNAAVVDKTGLTGSFDMVLEYEPANQPVSIAPSNPAVPEFASPPLRDALQQQLGLKLEQTRAPLPIVIIESVEMPTPD
jgi:uncharacterized protein (TIGR03435 family)